MRRFAHTAVALSLVLAAIFAVGMAAQRGDFLSDKEEEALRDAQDPARRIAVYLDLEDARLAQLDDSRDDPRRVNRLLDQFISLNSEMKDWIEYQSDHHGDMRKGLRALLDHGPQQLDVLRGVQEWPEAASSGFSDNLRDAIASQTDALNGSTEVLAEQEKLFGRLKREKKADARAEKKRIREAKKRAKEEKKLRERMRRKAQSDSDQN